AGGVEVGHQRGDEGVVRLVRHRRGFCAVVVAGKTKYAAVFRRTGGIAVPEHVATAVDARPLAVPDADHAIIFGAGREVELLRAPDRGGREILVHAGLKLDVVLFEMLAGGEKLLVVAAERRAAVAGNEAGGVEPLRAVAPDLRHRQPDQWLAARQEDTAGGTGAFAI